MELVLRGLNIYIESNGAVKGNALTPVNEGAFVYWFSPTMSAACLHHQRQLTTKNALIGSQCLKTFTPHDVNIYNCREFSTRIENSSHACGMHGKLRFASGTSELQNSNLTCVNNRRLRDTHVTGFCGWALVYSDPIKRTTHGSSIFIVVEEFQ